MDLESLIDKVGRDLFYSEAKKAKDAAINTGNMSDGYCSDIPHELSNEIWDSEHGLSEKLDLVFQLYEKMPCYGYLMYCMFEYKNCNLDEKILSWDYYRKYLKGEDASLSKPIEYSLWCDFFEDIDLVEESWKYILAEPLNELLIQRVLNSSGPVPFHLKSILYDKLIENPKWHYHIFRSILFSQYDVFGQIDYAKAREYFVRLEIPEDLEGYKELKGILC